MHNCDFVEFHFIVLLAVKLFVFEVTAKNAIYLFINSKNYICKETATSKFCQGVLVNIYSISSVFIKNILVLVVMYENLYKESERTI